MAVEEKTTEGLLGFDWEGDDVNFFEEAAPKPDESKEKEKETEEKEEETSSTKPEESEEEKEIDFFDEESDEDDEDKPKETSKPEGSGNYWEDVYNDFKSQGLLKHVDLEEGEELSAEKIFELQQQDYEAEVSARLTHWAKEELDADAQAFIKYKQNGGATEDFFKTYSSTTELPEGDIKETEFQDRVIRFQLREEGWDSEEIEDRVKYLTENGKKEQVAKRYNKKIQEKVDEKKQDLLIQSEERKKAVEQQEREFRDEIKGVLDETEEVKGFKISQKDKTELYSFLTKKNHKISDTKSVTGFQKKLGETFKDPDKIILLAKLINSDFDMSQFEKQVITKKTKQVKSNLEQRKNLRPNSGSSSQGTSLAELFN